MLFGLCTLDGFATEVQRFERSSQSIVSGPLSGHQVPALPAVDPQPQPGLPGQIEIVVLPDARRDGSLQSLSQSVDDLTPSSSLTIPRRQTHSRSNQQGQLNPPREITPRLCHKILAFIPIFLLAATNQGIHYHNHLETPLQITSSSLTLLLLAGYSIVYGALYVNFLR